MGTHGSHDHHIIPLATYVKVLAFLLVMTVITVAAARVDFGAMNAVIAMLIASVKAAAVLLYFMHLKYDDKVFPTIFFISIFFLIVMFAFSQLDIVTRIPVINDIR
jgi:cytochrome c oxidase subunit IV